MPREWNAVSYDRLPLPHTQWGRRTIERLTLKGDETVIDAGCGTGRDALLLLEKLPNGRVFAVDGSRKMLEQAAIRLHEAKEQNRATLIHTDLTGDQPLAELVTAEADAVISVAAFHWISDHDLLFQRLSEVMRPGAQLSVDCGGAGNIAEVSRVIDEVLSQTAATTKNFRGADETRKSLEGAGFTDVQVQLRPDPARFDDPAELREYLRTVILGAQLDVLPQAEHDAVVEAVATHLPEPVIDYVRLEFTARRA